MDKNFIKRLSFLALGSIILFLMTFFSIDSISPKLNDQLMFMSGALFISSLLIFIKAWIVSRIKMFKEKESKIILWLSIFIISILMLLALIMHNNLSLSMGGCIGLNCYRIDPLAEALNIINTYLYLLLIAASIISFIALISLTISCFINRKKNNSQINQ